MKFEIYTDSSKQYRWRLLGKNGEPIASGESYKNKADCQAAIKLVQSSASASVVEK